MGQIVLKCKNVPVKEWHGCFLFNLLQVHHLNQDILCQSSTHSICLPFVTFNCVFTSFVRFCTLFPYMNVKVMRIGSKATFGKAEHFDHRIMISEGKHANKKLTCLSETTPKHLMAHLDLTAC